ncbi:MAG: hypothetical protein K5895_07680 [Lachnospiraceae bacterium]|nr:hypothetical protein [Lachnospiraceae bacterium]
MKPYEELTIVDNFMFTKVMSNPEICKTFLEIVLDVKIKKISYPEDEKTITIASESKVCGWMCMWMTMTMRESFII